MNKYNDLMIITTDTIVGIAAPVSAKNLSLLYEIKRRPKSKPIVIMISNIKQLRQFIKPTNEFLKYADTCWPGPTTLIYDEVLSFRIPDCKELTNLINKIGPLYVTSANKSGKPFLDYNNAILEFPEIKKHYNFCKGKGKPSTIIDTRNGYIIR